jgi:hypothetical protein
MDTEVIEHHVSPETLAVFERQLLPDQMEGRPGSSFCPGQGRRWQSSFFHHPRPA